MSGRKYTEVELQRPVADVLETYRQVEEKLLDIEAFGTSVQRFSQSDEILSSCRRKIGGEVEMLKQEMERVGHALWDKVLEGGEIEWTQGVLQEILKKLAQLEDKCLEAEKEKVKVATLYYRLLQKKQRLHHWMPGAINKSDQRWENVLEGVKSFLSGPVEPEVREGLIRRLEMLNNKLSTMIKMCEQNHARRIYVVKAVKKVCEMMGFVVRDESRNTFSENLHLEVDTIKYGTMTFDFTLPGKVHTYSQQAAGGGCEKKYGQLEQHLEELGIITEFKYEIDNRPLDKESELDDILQVVEDFYKETTRKDMPIHTHSKG